MIWAEFTGIFVHGCKGGSECLAAEQSRVRESRNITYSPLRRVKPERVGIRACFAETRAITKSLVGVFQGEFYCVSSANDLDLETASAAS